jgi:hypothetical protein
MAGELFGREALELDDAPRGHTRDQPRSRYG